MRRKGFGFYLGRFLTAIMGLVLGLLIFLWQALGTVDFVNIQGVDQNNNNNNINNEDYLSDYFDVIEGQELGKLGHVQLKVDPDYPIAYVAKKDPQVENILVFGIDSRGEETARADTIMIVTVNQKDGSLKLTSVLRDTEMNMNSASGSRAKVNASYAYGGVGMLINTLNHNLDLDIQRFVMFDFWSAMGFVDALGGVTIPLAEREINSANRVIEGMARMQDEDPAEHYLTEAGDVRMNGIQAISWARIRDIDSDFGRTSRQRVLADKIIGEFAQKNLLSQGNFAVQVLGQLETNVDRANMIRIGYNSLGVIGTREEYSVPAEGMYYTNFDNWNMIYDPSLQIPALHDFIWNDG